MANTKFSALPVADALSGTEIMPVVQGGAAKSLAVDSLLARPVPSKAVTGEIAGVNPQVGAAYALQATDKGCLVVCTNANAITVSVPIGFKANTVLYIKQGGAGQVTLSPASGVTLETASTLLTRGPRSVLALIFHANDAATVVGDMA